MKQSDLSSALSFVASVAHGAHDVLHCVRLEASDGVLLVESTNGRAYATERLLSDASIDPVLVSAATLSRVVGGLSEEVEVGVSGKAVVVADEKARIRLQPAAPIDEFPSPFKVDDTSSYELCIEPFDGFLSTVARWKFTGRYVERYPLAIYPEGGGCYAASTPYYSGLWGTPVGDECIKIQVEDIRMLRNFCTNGDVFVSWGDHRVEFRSCNRSLSLQTSSLGLPDIRGIINSFFEEDRIDAVVDVSELSSAIRLLSPVAGDSSIKLELSEDLTMSVLSDTYSGSVSVPLVTSNGGDKSMLVSANLLSESVVGMPDQIELKFEKNLGIKSPWMKRVLAARWK